MRLAMNEHSSEREAPLTQQTTDAHLQAGQGGAQLRKVFVGKAGALREIDATQCG